jgi:subtilisin family serine protease
MIVHRWSRRALPFALALCVLSTAVAADAVSIAPAAKIAPRILADTTGGRAVEAMVVLTSQADLSGAKAFTTRAAKGRFVVDALRATAAGTQTSLRAFLDQRGVPYQPFYIVNAIKITGDLAVMNEIAARGDVLRIDANPVVRMPLPTPTGIDERATTTVEWNVRKVGADRVWRLGFRGEGRVVADADTGVDWAHPALKSHYRGWDGTTASHDFNWHDATSAHSATPVDPHSHGTFTTSQMVGDDGAGNQVGVAPGAKWIGCRNMDSGGNGTPTTYTECFEWLMAPYAFGAPPSSGDPSLAPDSINNSWGCPTSEGCSTLTLQAILESVRAAGIFPAVAAGNSGPGCSTIVDPPSLYDASVTVGATTQRNKIASFSSRGLVTADGSNRMKPDISAPGENIRGAVPGGGYQSGWSGTSMATPHVAGAVALVWQEKPSLIGDIDATEALLTSTAVPKTLSGSCGGVSGGSVPNWAFGYGILNILAAVQAP